ncbi:MAG: Uma2 family endonuclease [Nostoc sp. NMS1]|uniref:Uma2 family endonuclease n=1 Tax=unclassified Nostoc TaxID=2593658 RepID=UPI0025F5CA52|nr:MULTISPECIES: Uma2 family endonuclease [unclassified Nostoc]MBN3909606.1 Uma2 family endonuclease [Nostoc sp. NMS1]MBN3993730.1 Uma2 family endonuclease [Nostoc sp. NMS2]
MTQALAKQVTFDEFIAWYPESSDRRYELHDGVIVEMPKPTGKHSEIAGFINGSLFIEITRLSISCFIPKECVIKSVNTDSGYEPDVIVIDRQAVRDEPRWKKESIITQGTSVKLVVEVVSTNWSDDYALKLEDYESLGIPEYWIVDYLGSGGRRFIGNPKQPTISIYQLIEGEYQVRQFRGNDRIQSLAFPELNLTAEQIFQAGEVA